MTCVGLPRGCDECECRQVNYADGIDQSHMQAQRILLLALVPLLLPLMWWLVGKAVSFLRRDRWIIPAGGVIAYTLCSSGLVFSIIHSVPFVGYDQPNMRYVLLAPTSRVQYMLEGMFISGCSTMASLAALCLLKAPFFAEKLAFAFVEGRGKAANNAATTTENVPDIPRISDRERRWSQYFAIVLFALMASLFVLCSGFVMQCYRAKAAWYAPRFWPSPHLPKGPLKVDRGNAF